ncbi:MAG TPA: hypothetical protein ENN81_09450 [Phycisphaerales bacterium]|nr:hypothetical protein [Phycisphaerales bacterium]
MVFLESAAAGHARGEDAMTDHQILEELLALLEGNAVTVRNEPLGGAGGGLCTVKGRPVFFHDTDASSSDAACACAEAVARTVDIESIYLRPEVRDFIEARTNRPH